MICKLCGEPCFEDRGDMDSPRVVPNPGAERATLILADGRQANVTFCKQCGPVAEDNLPMIWAHCMADTAAQERDRPKSGRGSLTPEQAAHNARTLKRMADAVPLGVLRREQWSDLWQTRTGARVPAGAR